MKNSFAIKVIAACAGFFSATATFSHVSTEKMSAAPFRAASVPVAGLRLVAAADEPVTVTGGWVRSTVPGQKGSGAFMKITAKEGARLTGVSSPVAGVAEVHEMKMEGDVMKMRAVPVLDIPAGGTVELKPGGYHLMLMDLKQALPVGSTVPVTLTFKDGKGAESRVEVKLPVAATAPAPKAQGH
jgi:periplasmic copper chaperone A